MKALLRSALTFLIVLPLSVASVLAQPAPTDNGDGTVTFTASDGTTFTRTGMIDADGTITLIRGSERFILSPGLAAKVVDAVTVNGAAASGQAVADIVTDEVNAQGGTISPEALNVLVAKVVGFATIFRPSISGAVRGQTTNAVTRMAANNQIDGVRPLDSPSMQNLMTALQQTFNNSLASSENFSQTSSVAPGQVPSPTIP